MERHEQFFTIQQLSRRLNIPKPTLRFWEKELNGIIVPLRTKGRQRRYTLEHVAIIEEIKNFRDDGVSLAEVKEKFSNGYKAEGYDSNRIDLLANHIAEVVKAEISKFLQKDELKSKIVELEER